MLKIGAHLSISKGYLNIGKQATAIGANTFQYFSRNPRGGSRRALDIPDIEAFKAYAQQNNLQTFVAHAPYTLNACSAEPRTREFTFEAMRDDLAVMQYLAGNLYNFHPGSHGGQGEETGIAQIAETLNRVLTPDLKTTVLLEGMSGKGSEIGYSFEQLRAVIDRVECSDRMGVCLDTCHLYSAGYDIVNRLDEVLAKFDSVVGLQRLKAIHLNDSMTPFASHKDRHAPIGEGTIGAEALIRIINHPALRELPFELETPLEADGHAREIAFLKRNYSD